MRITLALLPLGLATIAHADPPLVLTHVPAANPTIAGATEPNVLRPELIGTPVAQGSVELENPATVTVGGVTVAIPHYGYHGNGPMLPAPGDLPSATHTVEATKTEPDKNTYLVLPPQHGA